MILVNADKINKSYTEKPLLQDISLSIHEGEKIGLIGVNGTGKSTLLRIIAGIEEPDSGKVVYTNDVRKAYLPQHPEYDGNLTVEEQAAKYMRAVDPETPDFACRSMMTKLGIRDFGARMEELSGGQREESSHGCRPLLRGRSSHPGRTHQPHGQRRHRISGDFLVRYRGAVL